jgi:hypothetical protein
VPDPASYDPKDHPMTEATVTPQRLFDALFCEVLFWDMAFGQTGNTSQGPAQQHAPDSAHQHPASEGRAS